MYRKYIYIYILFIIYELCLYLSYVCFVLYLLPLRFLVVNVQSVCVCTCVFIFYSIVDRVVASGSLLLNNREGLDMNTHDVSCQ